MKGAQRPELTLRRRLIELFISRSTTIENGKMLEAWLDQTLRLLIVSSFREERLLFKSGDCLREASILLSTRT